MSPASAKRAIGTWEILEVLGSGSFAIVWKARHLVTGAQAAVKEILVDRLNHKLKDSLESEIATLQRLSHANIVGLLDLVKEPGRIYLVLEYCGGGDLAHHLRSRGPLSEASCRYLLRHLAEGLKVLRQHQIIHRDLKPQNLLLSDSGPSPTLKIADFGFARSLQPAGMAETLCGSPLYMAPEVLQLHRYDASADLWSVGTILFELLTGKPPFTGANHLQLIQNIERGEAVLPDQLARSLSPGCRQLLSGLLRRNPAERLSFEDFFSHPFLQGEAASAAAGPVAGAAAAGGVEAGSSGRAGGSADCSSPDCSGGAGAASPHQALQRPRCTPESHGAVRFVQAARYGGPVHPAFQLPASPPASASSSSSQPQRQQQRQPQSPAGAGAPGSVSPSTAAGGASGGGTTSGGSGGTAAAGPAGGSNAAPSAAPRIVAAAAAVASVLMGGRGAGGGGGGGDGVAGTTRAAAAAAVGIGTVGSSGGPLADSLDSDYVVISSPSATPRAAAAATAATSPPPPPLVPRTPHPAMPGSGAPSRSASGGGGVPPPLQPQPALAAAAAAALPSTAMCTAGAPPAAAAPSWQQLLSPIAAASLPQGPVPGPGPAATAGTGPAGTMTIRLPAPGRDGEADDPLLLPRVVGAVLEVARARCGAVLDAEEEARQLAAAQQAAAALSGGSFAASGAAGGGGGGHAAAAAAAASALAEEAAAAVGTLLAACRLLAAALSPDAGSSGGGAGEGCAQEPRPHRAEACATGPLPGLATGAGGNGGLCQQSPAASSPALSREALAALAAHARSALAALDEHLSGPMAQLLLGSGDADASVLAPPTPSTARSAAPQHRPPLAPAQQHAAPLVPACCDALLGAAVHAARAAAGEEMLGNAAGAADQYGRAADVLAFLLTAPPPPPSGSPAEEPREAGDDEACANGTGEQGWDAVRPPLAPQDRQRLTRYYAAVRLRQSTVAAAAGPAAAAYQAQPYSYPYTHAAHATQPYAAHHDLPHQQQHQAPRGGLLPPHGYAQPPHGAGALAY